MSDGPWIFDPVKDRKRAANQHDIVALQRVGLIYRKLAALVRAGDLEGARKLVEARHALGGKIVSLTANEFREFAGGP